MHKLDSLISTYKTFEIDGINDNINDKDLLQEWRINNNSSLL